ncbi:hypothetical protein ABK040_006424 [Willaertia magna]
MPTNFSSEQYQSLNQQTTPPSSKPIFERLQTEGTTTTTNKSTNTSTTNTTNNTVKLPSKSKGGFRSFLSNIPAHAAPFERKKGPAKIGIFLGAIIFGTYAYTIWNMRQENFSDVVIPETFKEQK